MISRSGAPEVNLLEHLDYIITYLAGDDSVYLLDQKPVSQRTLEILRHQERYLL